MITKRELLENGKVCISLEMEYDDLITFFDKNDNQICSFLSYGNNYNFKVYRDMEKDEIISIEIIGFALREIEFFITTLYQVDHYLVRKANINEIEEINEMEEED